MIALVPRLPGEGAAADVHRARRRSSPPVAVAVVVLGIVLVGAVLAPWIVPVDPAVQDLASSAQPPSSGHLLGTDQLGRDVLSLLIAGSRPALLGPLAVAVLCLVIGGGLGSWAGYHGGTVDAVVTRIADFLFTVPALVVAIVVVGVTDGGYVLTVLVLTLLSLPFQVRMARSAAQVQARMPYVSAVRSLDLGAGRVLLRHVLPNTRPVLLTTFLLDFVGAFVGFASLAYLGIGVPAGSPNWGAMVAQGQALLHQNPWLALAPAVLLMLVASAATVLGDALGEASAAVERS